MPRKKKSVEAKTEEFKIPEVSAKKTFGQRMKKAGVIIFGILLVLAGIFEIIWFLPEFIAAFKGTIGTIVILLGILVVALGWLD
jgi:hypothetical protein